MNTKFLISTPLFSGMTEEEAESILKCLNTRTAVFEKGETILRAGEETDCCALLLSGSVNIESSDSWGTGTIMDHVTPGQIFGETYACLQNEPMMVSATAAEKCTVLLLDAGKVLNTCSTVCIHHSKLLRNLLTVTARKNLNLTRKVFHTSPRTTRGKLLSYLSEQALRGGSERFDIPFDRQQLADYLGVDRSAMSAELSRMKKEGLLDYHKNSFLLKTGRQS